MQHFDNNIFHYASKIKKKNSYEHLYGEQSNNISHTYIFFLCRYLQGQVVSIISPEEFVLLYMKKIKDVFQVLII